MILLLTGLLLGLMVLVGGERGFHSFVFLFVNGFFGMVGICLLCCGISPAAILVIGCAVFLAVGIPLQNGCNLKSLSAMLATGLILVLMGAAISAVCLHVHITGLSEIQLKEIDNSYLSSGVDLDMRAILLVSLVWGELGALMDTSITIASSMNEILAAHPNLTERELRSSGLQIGKNIIGTTVNTLVFIAFGETIMLCLLYISNGYSLVMLINSKSFFQQFGGILFSCQSCLLVVPLTAAIFARMAVSARVTAWTEKIRKRRERRGSSDR